MRISDWSSDVCSSDLILAANGIDIPVSCEQGICGTCVTRVLRGEPDHRDLFMPDQEHAANDQFTPCCSRARSLRLVLDLYRSAGTSRGDVEALVSMVRIGVDRKSVVGGKRGVV